MSNCIIVKGDVEDDSNVPDRVEDIKPRFHRARTQGMGSVNTEGDNELANLGANIQQHGGDQQGSDDEDEEEGADDETNTEWNLSLKNTENFGEFTTLGKCAAASLDVLSGIFGDEFLVHLLPILNEALFSEQWEVN